MHFFSKELVHTRTKGIESPMANIEDELWKLARTMYKMVFLLAMILKNVIWWNQI